MPTHNFCLVGPTPSKKNNYEIANKAGSSWAFDKQGNPVIRKGSRGLRINDRTQQMLDDLSYQLNPLWHDREPLLHPELALKFYVSTKRIDRDGMAVSLLDLLQPKFIFNDNVEYFNGRLVIEPAEIVRAGSERVEMIFTEAEKEKAA